MYFKLMLQSHHLQMEAGVCAMPRDVVNDEAHSMLSRYVKGRVSNAELEEWLVQVGYDEEVAQPEKEALARVRLALVEVSEGRRTPDEVLRTVGQLLGSQSQSSGGYPTG